MTTIVADRKRMSADRRVVHGSLNYSNRKLRRVGSLLVATAGDASAGNKFLAWIEEGDQDNLPSLSKGAEFDALVLTADGRLVVYDQEFQPDELEDEYYAAGSGEQAAMAGMRAGCSPAEAVALACDVDNATGPPIDTMWADENNGSDETWTPPPDWALTRFPR